uniref:Uncharacterized protein n=1 Tax=Brassica oleracea TaxID=3712 RepID=A0A3P6GSN9_BRAOL|nr:unnamed protein product [Brassica oleracea]
MELLVVVRKKEFVAALIRRDDQPVFFIFLFHNHCLKRNSPCLTTKM